jgi:hypothetical protein
LVIRSFSFVSSVQMDVRPAPCPLFAALIRALVASLRLLPVFVALRFAIDSALSLRPMPCMRFFAAIFAFDSSVWGAFFPPSF